MIYLIHSQQLILNDFIQTASIEDCIDYISKQQVISVDTETQGFDPHRHKMLLIQLGTKEHQYVVEPTESNILKLKPILENDRKLFIFHNAKFDLRFLIHLNIDVKNVYDTFLAECVLTTGLYDEQRNLSLNGVAQKYLNIAVDKTVRGEINRKGLTLDVVEYSAIDVMHLEDIMYKQLAEIHIHELQNILNLENKAVRVLAKIEYNGIAFNSDSWMDVAVSMQIEKKKLELELDKIIYDEGIKDYPKINRITKYVSTYKQGNLFFIEDTRKCIINWDSNQQKLNLLNDLGLNVPSVGDRILQNIRYKHKIISVLINYSKISKMVTAFGSEFLKFVNPVTKRIHAEHWQILSTGRLSMNSPNIQQIPGHGDVAKVVRSSFIATSGYKMVCADYQGFELAIIAEFSQDPVWINVLNNNGDLHGELCAMTFNIHLSDIRKPFPHKPTFTYRDVQKTVDFMLAYGGSEYKLSDVIQVDVKEARKIIKTFFSKVPKVKRFLDSLGELGKTRGYIGTPYPFKRIRWFPKWKEEYRSYRNQHLQKDDFVVLGEIERASKNMPIQATNANLIKYALIKLQEEIDNNKWNARILLTVHDEIIVEVQEDQAKDWKEIQEKIMINCAKTVISTVPINVEAKISDHWTK